MKWGAILVTAAALLGDLIALGACTTQPLHDSCPLDEEVLKKGVCNGKAPGPVSCVVRHHPQCDQSVCLSYYSNPAICTKACVGDTDCPSSDVCYTYAEAKTGTAAEKYCVPTDLPTGTTSK